MRYKLPMRREILSSSIRLVSSILFGYATILPCSASDFQSARTAALGGAGHAAPLLNDSIYLNPSFESFLPTYTGAANYFNHSAGAVDAEGSHELHGRGWNASLHDGKNEW